MSIYMFLSLYTRIFWCVCMCVCFWIKNIETYVLVSLCVSERVSTAAISISSYSSTMAALIIKGVSGRSSPHRRYSHPKHEHDQNVFVCMGVYQKNECLKSNSNCFCYSGEHVELFTQSKWIIFIIWYVQIRHFSISRHINIPNTFCKIAEYQSWPNYEKSYRLLSKWPWETMTMQMCRYIDVILESGSHFVIHYQQQHCSNGHEVSAKHNKICLCVHSFTLQNQLDIMPVPQESDRSWLMRHDTR